MDIKTIIKFFIILICVNIQADSLSFDITDIATGSYWGLGLDPTASGLLINSGNMYKDLALLQEKQKLMQIHGEKILESKSILAFTGNIEGQISYNGQTQSWPNDLSNAELDLAAWVNPWAAGYMSFSANNQTITMPLAFITIGNLDKNPVYFTVGQLYVPFGKFSSNFSNTSPLTKSIGRILAQPLKIGFYNADFFQKGDALYALAAVYNNQISSPIMRTKLNRAATTLGYKGNYDKVRTDTYISYTTDISEATGIMASVGNGLSAVDGFDAAFKISCHNFTTFIEYITALQYFNTADWTVNGLAVKPRAYNIELAYDIKQFTKKMTLALAYQEAFDTFPASRIKQQYGTNLTVNIMRYLTLSFEYMRKSEYKNITAVFVPLASSAPTLPLGQEYNSFATTLDLYF